ncbi:MAG: hypothetical protein EA424_29460, partial [Planctomycetaceae bacterium]
MSKRNHLWLFAVPLVMLATTLTAMADLTGGSQPSELATFDSPTGETFFALSLNPTEPAPAATGHDVLVLFDTSASQTGAYRDDAIRALNGMLSSLGSEDRVKLMSIDLNAVAMTEQFVAPGSQAMRDGLARLQQRVPLGSTDMQRGLRGAAENFSGPATRPRALVYMGDGHSRANLLYSQDMESLVSDLTDKQIPVSSYAIGPGRDLILLATLANQTGGKVHVDAPEGGSAEQAGQAMAQAARGTVYWPKTADLPGSMRETLPSRVPPLRSDRDTVLIGMLDSRDAASISMTMETAGQTLEMSWEVQPQASNEDYRFLPDLVSSARSDGGIRLPTVGSSGLAEVAQMMVAVDENLARLGENALRTGNVQGALQVAETILQRDPNNPQARAIVQAARNMGGRDDDPGLRLVNIQDAPDAAAPAAGRAVPGGNQPGALLQELLDSGGGFMANVENLAAIDEQRMRAQVEQEMTEARDRMRTNPEGAKRDLKLLLETIDRSDSLTPENRTQLRRQVEGAIREAERREIEVRNRRELAEANRAASEERQRAVEETARTRQKIKQMLDRFNSLMAEGRYNDAEDIIAFEVRELDPYGTTPVAAVWWSRFSGHVHEMEALREVRHRNFARALLTVEKALVPFPDEPPVMYPEPQVWADLSLRRRQYAAIDLARRGSSEEKIMTALDDDTTLDFIESPLQQVLGFLADLHDINIEANWRLLDMDEGITTETTVTRNLQGITLRSALRLLLRDLSDTLTYVIRDEVLLITTLDDAESELVTKVYPVGDLVLPIIGGMPMGGMGGGMGGGMMGGMGGGM